MEPRSELAATSEDRRRGHGEEGTGTLELDPKLVLELGLAETFEVIRAHYERPDRLLSAFSLLSEGSLNAKIIKGLPGELWGWHIYNSNAAVRFLKLYDVKDGPSVGDVKPKLVLPIPGASVANVGLAKGVEFVRGIGMGLTTGIADSDKGAVVAAEIMVNLFYR